MKKYAKAIAIVSLAATGNLAFAGEPVALSAQQLDSVSAGFLSISLANATNTTTADAIGSHPAALAAGGSAASAGHTPSAISAGGGAATAFGPLIGAASVSSVNTATALSVYAH